MRSFHFISFRFVFFCDVSRSRRLGNLKGGVQDIKNHRWFQEIDFKALLKGEIAAPIVPDIKADGDTQNFEPYPEIPQSSDEGTVSESLLLEVFKDF